MYKFIKISAALSLLVSVWAVPLAGSSPIVALSSEKYSADAMGLIVRHLGSNIKRHKSVQDRDHAPPKSSMQKRHGPDKDDDDEPPPPPKPPMQKPPMQKRHGPDKDEDDEPPPPPKPPMQKPPMQKRHGPDKDDDDTPPPPPKSPPTVPAPLNLPAGSAGMNWADAIHGVLGLGA